MEEYSQITSIQNKEEFQFLIQAKDIYCEDMKIVIQNQSMNEFNKNAIISFYNTDNKRLQQTCIQNQFVILSTHNSKFFSLYTNEGQLQIYSSRTFRQLKSGLIIEGVCMIDSNEDIQVLVLLTLKSVVKFYKVKSTDISTVDGFVLEQEANFSEILKQRQLSPSKEPKSNVYISNLFSSN